MSFLFPAFLLGAFTIAIPLVLHLMRRERAPLVPFSAVRFVRRSATLRTRRLRLRELLLLALRVTALLLLAVAFARPFVDEATPARPVTVVAVDRSLSMSAPGQMAQARALAAEAIADAPAGHRVALVAFDDRATLVLEPTADRASAAAAVASVAPAAGGTRYAAALSAAAGALGPGGGRIVVVTDLQGAGWRGAGPVAVPASAAVELAVVAPVAANLAVTAITRTAGGISAVVLDTGDEPREALVLLALDDEVLASRVAALAPGANVVGFEQALPEVGVVAVQVVDPDGYAGDDRRYLLLDAVPPARVLAVAAGGASGPAAFFVDRALSAGAGDRPFALRAVAPDALSSLAPGTWDQVVAVLVLGTSGLDAPGRERLAGFVRAGGGVLLAAGPGVEPAPVAGIPGGDVRIRFQPGPGAGLRRWVTTDRRHPVFRALGEGAAALGEVSFRGAAAAGEPSGARVLGRFDDGAPALVEYDAAPGRVLFFASDLNGAWNDFPRRPGFAPFLHEALGYLARHRGGPRDVTVADTPPGVPAAPGGAVVPESGRRIVVNTDPRESHPAPTSREAFLARVTPRGAAGDPLGGAGGDAEGGPASREREQAYWWYVLAAMLAVLVAEAWLARSMA